MSKHQTALNALGAAFLATASAQDNLTDTVATYEHQKRKAQLRKSQATRRAKVAAMGDREYRCFLRAMECPEWDAWIAKEQLDPKTTLREALIFGMKFRMRMGRGRQKRQAV